MVQLAERKCVPCSGDTPPLKGQDLQDLQDQLGSDWQVADEHHLHKEFKFRDFRQALDFTNAVGELAEEQNHHPEIRLTWGKVGITLWTHAADGLTESDFILAAKIEELPHPRK
jgi:4a-hydroxytetrahydrobiopterin dehydratase